jgi:hypothetical protein
MKTRILALMAINPPLTAAIIAGAAVLIIGGIILTWAFWHSDSPNEIKADEARVETIAADADLTVANKNLETSTNSEKVASKKAKEARKPIESAKKRTEVAKKKVDEAVKPVSNVDLTEAKRLQCLAYPEDCQ